MRYYLFLLPILLFTFNVGVVSASSLYDDNFDSGYTVGDVDGQNGWSYVTADHNLTITSDNYYSSPYSLKQTSRSGYTQTFTAQSEAQLSFMFYYDDNSANPADEYNLYLMDAATHAVLLRWERVTSSTFRICSYSGGVCNTLITDIPSDTWVKMIINISSGQYTVTYDGTTSSVGDNLASFTTIDGIKTLGISSADGDPIIYYDDFGIESTVSYYSTSTRVISSTPPLSAEPYVTSSTSVTYDIDYFSNVPLADEICIIHQDLTIYQSFDSLCTPVTASGLQNFSTTTTYNTDSFIMFQVIFNYQNQLVHASPYGYFSVVNEYQNPYSPAYSSFDIPSSPSTSTTTLSEMNLQCDPNSPLFERSICNLFVLLLVPSNNAVNSIQNSMTVLNTKIPFSIVYTFKNAIDSIETVPTDQTQTALSLTFNGEDIQVLSTTTIEQTTGIGSEQIGIFRYLIAVSLWIAFALFAYNRARGLLKL